MKTILTKNINEFKIIAGIGKAYLDPIATIRNIQKKGIKITDENKKELFYKHAVYLNNLNEKIISDEEAKKIKEKLDTLNKNELLCENLSIVKNYIGENNYKKIKNKWIVEKIDKLNIIPDKNKLSENEQLEYSNQIELERINKLTIEEKTKEKETIISSLAFQALQKEGILRIQGFLDYEQQAKKWFEEEKTKIEKKYK